MNWSDIFIYDTTWLFAGELVVRVVIMFTLITLLLRFTGERADYGWAKAFNNPLNR
ncbi:MAG TPA: hypothetical protein H9906_02260 [Candidatus Paenalcaligenes intestinipullorum]|uniref:Uncharacterized protein n=1 Tax=Candidatus Paenalcaligenes intestinipullorum TaxID=2838718 RepID=A0A9D2RFD8_9BURK|nr:hypothetical protein [Candidatus Paenalcaligenes intestinipullorum]